MNFHFVPIIAGALALVACGGCRRSVYEPSTRTEAQQIYSRTKWYFARQIAFSKLVPAPRTPSTPPDSENQTFFDLASGTRIIYTEFMPDSGLKAFHGLGRLKPIPNLACPVYRLEDTYTAEHPGAVILVGFCGERMFRVQAQGTSQLTVLADAVSLATNALVNLRDQTLHP